ncbi:unnamed protein product [Rhizoctonia solani]|uniref:Uncharacterized protein n=1 Tax=Rhizoctonia solani TaxID=456999 RepID=A0A8H3CMF5_9AGAM|nr:unnamed protein product [Rhizoctonia solani]
MAARFVVSNPALAPLFAAVGAGVVGAGWYGAHVLKNNQEVLIARGANPTPWNNLYSPNADFWKSRIGMPDPRSAFAATSNAIHEVAHKASAKVQEVKERAIGR